MLLSGISAQQATLPFRPMLLQDEDFYQISLDVRGKRTLAESLDSYVQRELMDGENQWLCEELGKKVSRAERGTLRPATVFG